MKNIRIEEIKAVSLLQHSLIPQSLSLLVTTIGDHFSCRKSSAEIMSNVEVALKEFGKKGVEEVIREIIQDQKLLTSIAAISYLHKNGFYKLILADSKDFKLRLHIWLPGTIAYETLHSHRWHFSSTIIVGKLQSEILGRLSK